MALALHTKPAGSMAGIFADKALRRQLRRREGGFRIIDAQPGTPQTVASAICYLAVGQALVFELGWSEHVEKARGAIYRQRQRPGGAHYVTRSYGRLLAVMRVE
jgi:hypothetical protein